MAEEHFPEDDFLDGCELDFDVPELATDDDQVDALVLFADVEFDDEEAVQKRMAEYKELAEAGEL